MIYYACSFALTLLLAIRFEKSQNAVRLKAPGASYNRKVWFSLLPLIFLALFRWNVGADSLYQASYWQAYHQSVLGLNERNFEPGFFWFMRLFAELKTPFFWFLFVHGVFFFACSSYAIRRGSPNVTWSIAIFFLLSMYFDSYSSLRQSLAEAICLIGWAKMGIDCTSWKKDVSILALFLIATLFHSTALLNIPIYILCKFQFRNRSSVLLFAVVAIGMSPLLQKILPSVMSSITNGAAYTTVGLARINLAVTGLFFALVWIFYDEIVSHCPNGYMYVNQALFSFILMLNSGAMYLPYRVYDMIKIGYVFIVPTLICSISDARSRILIQLLLACVCVALFANFITYPTNPYIHYQSALSNWWHIIALP